jgi:hypothetical protein
VSMYFLEECIFFSALGFAASFSLNASHDNSVYVLMLTQL